MIKSKRLLRFYFKADELDGALNNLILTYAYRSADCVKGGEFYAERILAITESKKRLAELWEYLDGIISALKSGEVETLKCYALMRCGIRRLDEAERRAIKRVVIKFSRHARVLARFDEGVRLVGEYYCLL